jgi:hypothetical protein
MRSAVIALLAFGGLAWGDPPPAPVAVKSVTAPSERTAAEPLWKVVMPDAQSWCQAKASPGPGEPLTIVLAAPAAITSITIDPDDAPYNTVDTSEVTADGKVFKAARPPKPALGRNPIEVKLSGAPVSQLVIRVIAAAKGNDVNCVRSIELHTTPAAPVIYGVDASAAAALWPSLTAVKDALASCNAKAIEAQFALPFSNDWYTMSNDGMKSHTKAYKTAAAVAKDCKRTLRKSGDAMKLDGARVQTVKPGQLEVQGEGTIWRLELDGTHWRVRSFSVG